MQDSFLIQCEGVLKAEHNVFPADVQGTCATTGEGLYEGLSWLQSTLTQREVKKAVVKPVKEVVKSEITPLSSDKPAKKPVTSSWWGMISSYFKISPGPVS